MRRWITNAAFGMFVAILTLLCPHMAAATDIPIFPTGPVFRLNGLVWGTSTQPGFNNNYFLTPININENVCIYVRNNNTTSPHKYTATITVTSDPSNTTPSDGTWSNVTTLNSSSFAPASPGVAGGIGANISGVAQISINLSQSTTQAGSPDTANVSIVQTQGPCFGGQNFTSGFPQPVSSTTALQSVTDTLAQGYATSATVTNPGIGRIITGVQANEGGRNLYFDSAVISSTAAGEVDIVVTQGAGTTCGTSTVFLRIGNGTASTSAGLNNCAANPTTTVAIPIQVGANIPVIIDLKGFIAQGFQANAALVAGLAAQVPAAITGNVSVSIRWYEK